MTQDRQEHAALRLRKLRNAAGLTQADMAGRMGFKTPSGYARWENPDVAHRDFLPADKIAQLLEILTPRGVSESAVLDLGFKGAAPVAERPMTDAAGDPTNSATSVDARRLKDSFGIVLDVLKSGTDDTLSGISGGDLATLAFAVYDEATLLGHASGNRGREAELRKIAEDVIRIGKMLKG